jgi:hypothetical protein
MSQKQKVITARLNALRKDAKAVQLLQQFLRASYGFEAVMFTLRAHELPAAGDVSLSGRVKLLANEFLRDDAPSRLPLPSNVRAPLLAEEAKREAFIHLADTALQDDVYEALYRFFNSAVFREHEAEHPPAQHQQQQSSLSASAHVAVSSSSSSAAATGSISPLSHSAHSALASDSPVASPKLSGLRRWLSPNKSAQSPPPSLSANASAASSSVSSSSAAAVAHAHAHAADVASSSSSSLAASSADAIASPSSAFSPTAQSTARVRTGGGSASSVTSVGGASTGADKALVDDHDNKRVRALPIGLSFVNATRIDDESSSSSSSEIDIQLDVHGLAVLRRIQRRARVALRIRRWRRLAVVLRTHFSSAARRARNATVRAFVDDELRYAAQLKALVDLFAKPLAHGKCDVTPAEHRVIVGPLVALSKAHSTFAAKLKKAVGEFPRKTKIADVIASLKDETLDDHVAYDRICDGAAIAIVDNARDDDDKRRSGSVADDHTTDDHDDDDATEENSDKAREPMTRAAVIEMCLQRSAFVDHVQKCYEDERCNFDMLTMLDAPRGRVQYYVEQLQELLDLTPRDHVDFDDTVACLRRFARFAPLATWQGESDERQLEKLQRRISGFDVMSGGASRALALEATLYWRDAELPSLLPSAQEGSRVGRAHVGVFHFFLFTDVLVRVRKVDDDNFKFKTSLPVARLSVDCLDTVCADLSDYTKVRWPLRLTDSQRSYTLGFETRAERQTWRRALLLLGAKNALLSVMGGRNTLGRDGSHDGKRVTIRAAPRPTTDPAAAAFDRSTVRGSGRWTSQQSAPVPKEALSKTACPFPRLPAARLLALAQADDSRNDVTGYGADGLVLRRNPLYGRELPWARVKLPETKPIIADSFMLARESSKRAAKAAGSGGGGSDSAPSSGAIDADRQGVVEHARRRGVLQFCQDRDRARHGGRGAVVGGARREARADARGDARLRPPRRRRRHVRDRRDAYAADIVKMLAALCASDQARVAQFGAAFSRDLAEDIRVGSTVSADSDGLQAIGDVLASPRRNPNANVTPALVQRVRHSVLSDLKLAARDMAIRDTPLKERNDVWEDLLAKSPAGNSIAVQLDQWEVEVLTPRTRERHRHRHAESVRRHRARHAPAGRRRHVARARRAAPPRRSPSIGRARARSRSRGVARRKWRHRRGGGSSTPATRPRRRQSAGTCRRRRFSTTRRRKRSCATFKTRAWQYSRSVDNCLQPLERPHNRRTNKKNNRFQSCLIRFGSAARDALGFVRRRVVVARRARFAIVQHDANRVLVELERLGDRGGQRGLGRRRASLERNVVRVHRKEHSAHRVEHAIMQHTVGRDHAAVQRQRRAAREVERAAAHVGDGTAGLLDNHAAGGVVPDLLLVAGTRRQPQINGRFAARHHGVLALRVEPHRRQRDAEHCRNVGGVVVRRVALLDRLGEARRRDVLDAVDAHRSWPPRRQTAPRQPLSGSAITCEPLPTTPTKQAAGRRGVAGRRVAQIRAAEHAEHDLAVLDERQTHRILFATQKTLGAVDRIDGPEAALGAALVVAAVDRLERGVLGQLLVRTECAIGERGDKCAELGSPLASRRAAVWTPLRRRPCRWGRRAPARSEQPLEQRKSATVTGDRSLTIIKKDKMRTWGACRSCIRWVGHTSSPDVCPAMSLR